MPRPLAGWKAQDESEIHRCVSLHPFQEDDDEDAEDEEMAEEAAPQGGTGLDAGDGAPKDGAAAPSARGGAINVQARAHLPKTRADVRCYLSSMQP